jgi:hypothetical protein
MEQNVKVNDSLPGVGGNKQRVSVVALYTPVARYGDHTPESVARAAYERQLLEALHRLPEAVQRHREREPAPPQQGRGAAAVHRPPEAVRSPQKGPTPPQLGRGAAALHRADAAGPHRLLDRRGPDHGAPPHPQPRPGTSHREKGPRGMPRHHEPRGVATGQQQGARGAPGAPARGQAAHRTPECPQTTGGWIQGASLHHRPSCRPGGRSPSWARPCPQSTSARQPQNGTTGPRNGAKS